MKTRMKWLLMAGVVGLFGMGKAQAAASVDGTVTVTPVATVNLALAPTTYAFGNVDVGVGISTVAVSSITLSNTGSVSVTIDKRITDESSPAGWTAGTAAAQNTYVLYVATSTFQPNPGGFTAGDHRFGLLNAVTSLDGLGGSTPTIGIAGAADLWFKLDMPTSVANQTARTITVRFTGTAQ